jgi:subtilisin
LKKLFFSLLVFAFALVVGLIYLPSIAHASTNTIAPQPDGVVLNPVYGTVFANDYVVELQESLPTNFIDDKVQEVNQSLQDQGEGGYVDRVYSSTIKGFSLKNVQNISMFVNDPEVKSVVPDTFNVENTQYRPTGIPRLGANLMTGAAYKIDAREGQPNIDIAVIDNRVWINHPDLNLFRNVEIVSPSQTKDRESYHGIHVAGIVAARDNLAGVVGIIPGARIWSISVFDKASGGAAGSSLIAAYDYIRQNAGQIEIATMSIGCGGGTPAACAISSVDQNAITAMVNAGVTFFVSAGNDHRNSNGLRFCGAVSAICVSALTDNDGKCGGLGGSTDDKRADYSNYGSDVDIMAPGTNILSLSSATVDSQPGAYPSAPYIGSSVHGGYKAISGTSMATPYVAGIGAIIKLNNPSFTPAQVKSNLLSNAYVQTQSCSGSKGGLASGANSDSSEKIAWAGNY